MINKLVIKLELRISLLLSKVKKKFLMHSVKFVVSLLHLWVQVISKHPHYTMITFFKVCENGHFQHKVIMCQTHPRLMSTQTSTAVRADISLFSLSEESDNPLFPVLLVITFQISRRQIKKRWQAIF